MTTGGPLQASVLDGGVGQRQPGRQHSAGLLGGGCGVGMPSDLFGSTRPFHEDIGVSNHDIRAEQLANGRDDRWVSGHAHEPVPPRRACALPGLVGIARPTLGVLCDLLRLELGQPLVRQGGLLRSEDVDACEVPITPIVGDLFIV